MIRNLGQVAAIYIGSSAPRNTNLIWLDNTVVPFVFRAYDGSAWSEIATHKWVRAYVDGWLVTLPPRQLADDGDYILINSNNVNYKITVKDFVKSAVGNPLDFKGVIRVSADFPNPSTLESGDMYVIITSPAGGTVTDPYSGKTFEDSEKIVWDEVTQSWESLGKIDITVDLTTSYSETEVTIHSSAGKETTIQGATDQLAGVMLPGQYSWLQALSNGSIVPGDPSPLTPLTPAHKHNYNDIINRLVSQQGTGESTIDPMSQKATTDALNLKFDKASVLQVSGAATDKVMSQKAVTDALKTLSDDFNNKLTNYLPLAGGTMKGSIRFPVGLGIVCEDVSGSAAYGVLRTWNFNNSTRMYVGTVNFPTYISSTASDLIHDRNGSSYLLWDTYNLPTPASTTDLANYLPLAGGTMKGSINLGNMPLLASISQGIATLLSINNTNNIETLRFGNTALDLNIYSSDKDLIHYRYLTPYKIWDSYNLSKPTVYNGGAIGTPTTIYDRNLSVNGTGWTFLSATNAPTTSIFAPTTVGTKGYYLVSSGTGAPVWQQLEDLGDGKYLPLIGGTLTGQVTIRQNVDIKLRLQSTDADNYCIIQAINAQASQLGVLGYAGDKWAIGHGRTYYEIWDKYNLSDPATKSGNNSFTGTNSFVGGKFSVAGSAAEVYVSAAGNLVTRSTYGTTGWLRSLEFSDNAVVVARFGVNATTENNVPTTNFVGILVGDGSVNDSQYKFRTNKLTVPESWSLDDPNGNALVWSQSSTLAHLGRASGTTKIRSGNVNLIHTKGTTDYTILDSSNYTEFLPQNIAWTYGFVSHAVNNDGYDANSMIGVDKPKLLFNYYTPGKIVNAPTGMSYGNVLQIDGPYTSSYNEAALKTQLAFDIIHNVDNGTGRMWYRTANNKGMAVANWRRVLTADENIARLSFDGNNYPAIIRVDGTTYPWLRANGNGFLPNVEKSLASGGASQLGSSSWAFLAGYIASVYTNKLVFGVTGPYMIASTNAFQFLDSAGGVHKVAAGSLYVGPSYASNVLSLVPANGIYSSGVIKGAAGFSSNFRQANLNLASTAAYSLYISSFIEGSTSAPGADPISGRTVNDGVLLTYFWGGDFAFQLAGDIDGSGIAYRSYAPSTGVSSLGWRFLADTSWVINTIINKLTDYLPLTGGIVTGDVKLNTEAALYTAANSGSGYSYYKTISYDNDKGIILGASNTSIKIQSSDPRIYHIYKGTEYEIYSTNNLSTPVFAPGKVAGSLTPIYNNSFYINDSSYKVATIDNSYSFPKIYSPTSAGTSGQILQSTGGVPKWVNASSIGGDYVSKSGATMTGILAMNSRRLGVVIDVIGGAGNSWNEGPGALSVQVPSDSGQTPLLLARRSGATINTKTLSERLLDMALVDTGTIFRVGMSGVNALELEVTSFTNKVGIGKLFGKTIATTDQIPSIPSISISNSGTGNAVTSITANGHTLTVTKGATYLTSHQTIYNLTFQAGTFSAKTFDPNGAAATVNIPTNTSHLTNDSGFITSSALNGYATQAWVNSQNFVKSTSTKKVTDIQPVDALPATQASGVLYLVFG